MLCARRETAPLSEERSDTARTELIRGRAQVVEGQLRAQLEETAAYRAYARQANAERLVSGLS